MIDNNIQQKEGNNDYIINPQITHCGQLPDLDGVIQVVAMISDKDPSEIKNMVNSGKMTLTCKIIKNIFKEIGFEGKWCYNTSYFKKNKKDMEEGLLNILTGKYKPSIVIRGDIYDTLSKEK